MQGDLNCNMMLGVCGGRESNSDYRSAEVHQEGDLVELDWDLREKGH